MIVQPEEVKNSPPVLPNCPWKGGQQEPAGRVGWEPGPPCSCPLSPARGADRCLPGDVWLLRGAPCHWAPKAYHYPGQVACTLPTCSQTFRWSGLVGAGVPVGLSQWPHPKRGLGTPLASPYATVTPAKCSLVNFSFHFTKLCGKKLCMKEKRGLWTHLWWLPDPSC